MAASRSGLPIVADTAALSRLSRGLRAASKSAWKAYRVGAMAGAELVLKDAQSRASFSTRIPASGRVGVTAGGNPKVIFTAPNAAPIENKGKGFVRHPTYSPRPGVSEKVGWTDENSHGPFAQPALDAKATEVVALIEKALTDAISRIL